LKIKFWLGILISAFFLYLFGRQIDFAEIWQILKSVNYFYLILTAVLQILTLLIRAERWKYIFNPIKRIKTSSLFTATVIGFMSNYIFPARMGEVIKAYVIGYREQVSKSASFATVVVERLFDGFGILLFLIIVVVFYPFPADFYQNQYVNPHNLRIAGVVSGGLYLLVLGFLLILKHKADRVTQFLDNKRKPNSSKLWDKLIHIINSFSQGLESLKGGWHIAWIMVLSFMVWGVIFTSFYVAYPAFGLQLSFFSAVLLTVLIAAAVAMPSSPGFIGTYHFACAIGLTLLGVEANKAKGFAILVHAAAIIPVIILGLVFSAREGLNLRQLQKMESE
jgi:uncharacterized protein (TIRG00374 family)